MTIIWKILLALTPSLLLLWFVYRKCGGKSVKFKTLALAFGGVLLTVIPLGIIRVILKVAGVYSTENQTTFDILWENFIKAAVLEEFLKFSTFYIILKSCYKQKGSGIVVIAAATGLGFAFMENLFHIQNDNWISIGIFRTFLSVPDHFSYGVIMGSMYFFAQYFKKAKVALCLSALIIPIFVHWLGNAIVLTPELDRYNMLLTLLWSIFMFICAWKLIKKTHRLNLMATSKSC